MTPTQRYNWAEAYLIGVKNGVLLRNVFLPGPTVPDEVWWSSSEPVERYYRYVKPSDLRDRLDKLYAGLEYREIPVEDALGCVIAPRQDKAPDNLCIALALSVAQDRKRDAAEAAKVR